MNYREKIIFACEKQEYDRLVDFITKEIKNKTDADNLLYIIGAKGKNPSTTKTEVDYFGTEYIVVKTRYIQWWPAIDTVKFWLSNNTEEAYDTITIGEDGEITLDINIGILEIDVKINNQCKKTKEEK